MRKKKDIEVVIHKDIEKEMKRIADNRKMRKTIE